MANSNLAHLDAYIRKVGPDKAVGGRPWSSYTWHGDQPPDHPFWNGIQTSDIDHADMRFSKLHVSWGKNFVEHKMPEAHWFIECMERGGRIVVIVPEYSPPATKADYWIPLRPSADGALFLGVIKVLMDERSEEHTSELQSLAYLVCRLLLEKKKKKKTQDTYKTNHKT